MTELDHDMQVLTAGPEWAGALIELLERQQGLVERLGALSTQQASLVLERRTDALLGLLAERQRIIEEFTRAQEELGVMTTDIETRLETVDETRRTLIQTLISDIGERLAIVMERDAKDQTALGAARGDVKGELASLDANRQARSAYRNSGAVTNRFADRKG